MNRSMSSRSSVKNLARALSRPSVHPRQGFLRQLHDHSQAPGPPSNPPTGSNGKSHYLWAAAGGLALASILYNVSPLESSVAEHGPDAAPVSVAGDPHGKLIAYDEVLRHNTKTDCWVIINGEVYDVTKFMEIHPGGVNAILKMAGKDATKAFMPIHPPDALSTLPPEYHVGTLDPTTAPAAAYEETEEEIRIRKAREALPHPEAALNLQEIEELAKGVLTRVAYAYYSSAGDDEYTFRENAYAFKRYWFRPRVMNRVSTITTSTTFMGYPVSLPVFICPAALARLGHPDGEVNIVQAAAKEGVAQGLSINASCSLDEIKEAKTPDQTLFFQIYLDRNRKNSENLLRRVEKDGYKGIILTVDSAVPGKRERDMRAKGDFQAPATGGANTNGTKGVAQAISGYQDPDITWDDIAWIKSITKLPLMVKGIQCVEDVEKAYKYGVKAVVLSNHGGRSLDFSPPPIDILYELRQKRPDLLSSSKFEVYIDGGVRRGTDVLKALCLGAKGVGLGRPVLYGNTGWGEDGVRRVIQIIREEVETGMRLLGVTRVEDLKPEMVRYMGSDPAPRR